MNISEMIEILQYYDQGGEVECQNSQGEWRRVLGPPSWNFGALSYRKRPVTKTYYIHVLRTETNEITSHVNEYKLKQECFGSKLLRVFEIEVDEC